MIAAKIKGCKDPDSLSRRMIQQGFTSWVSLSSKDVFVKLRLVVETDETKTYLVPELIRDKEPRIVMDVSETGGNGTAVVVAGGSGKKLQPFRRLWEVNNSSVDHASFSVHGSVVLVTAQKNRTVEIVKHNVFAGDTRLGQEPLDSVVEQVVLKETVVWSGQADELPSNLGGFRNAVKAATRKALSDKLGVFFAVTPKKRQTEECSEPTSQDQDLLDVISDK